MAIAGHRTTNGAPFQRINEVEPGDPIRVTTTQGVFRYRVRELLSVDPSRVDVLDGLTTDQAHAKPNGLPHSIADIVAHMYYWQEWFNRCAIAGFTGIPQHAADGWPSVSSDGWDEVRTRFLRSIEEAKRITTESESLDAPLLPPDVHIPTLARESHGSGILHAAVHSSHHLGQIITIRQLMGLWPPPGGSITW